MPTHAGQHRIETRARQRQAAPTGTVEPDHFPTLTAARRAVQFCRRCPLWQDAPQAVFGEGPEDARVIFVGEQPGDQEDLTGRSFVGPAGKVFDAVLEEAGFDRSSAYVTNAVKHFKFEPRGKRRLHKRPNAGEVQACRWWIDNELLLVRPKLVVALGATAAQSLLGKAIPIMRMRGDTIERPDGLRIFVTIHPSFIIRIRDDDDRQAERTRFLADIKAVMKLLR